ncbi:hypothetical protein E1B28_004370 [Marasmius oreades]|uniref:Membrane anchor Opy2 N-terminal domain-containing protein n=1 Tax=Marasmius oreades TaxID=181124 RepID=A0A9P8AD01_9AGAR|nr:uncharacterized protein E1B28_004370 [Marasmius oreades]KAG7096973.1 hypothetical protein E1B28_004370 [Marasmius oreades]
MRIEALFARDDCCTSPPSCAICAPNQDCIRINQGCNCPTVKCVSRSSESQSDTSSSSAGVSKGAVAGAVVGVLIFLTIAVGLFWWYRRRARSPEPKSDIPASAEDVLKRPDPIEKPSPPPTELNTVRVYSTSSNTTIDLDPQSQISHNGDNQVASRTSVRSNPFSDNHSIQTAGTEGTNVIPIALVPPEAGSLRSQGESTRSASPVRPVRTPDTDLNLDHVNVSHDSLRPNNPKYATSQISGVSGVSSRHSYMTNASYSSDFLNEAPMIVTANKGPVRQLLGVRKAEVISAGSLTPTTPDSLRVQMARPAITSPLAATSFGPSDVASISDKASVNGSGDPFSDKHSSTRTTLSPSSAGALSTTFNTDRSSSPHSSIQNWTPDGPNLPWAQGKDDLSSRPSSLSTQAGSVIDIASATRVNIGLGHLSPPSTAGVPRSPFRTTMGRLVSPPTGAQGTFEEQQQMALAHAQAQARAQGLDNKSRRVSGSSVVTSASVGDSILESFPFVPPSPISNRPVRSPPVSPLVQSFSSGPSTPMAQQTFVTPPSPSPSSPGTFSPVPDENGLPLPPDRRTLGLSTGSQLSTASSGLGSFPFHIHSGSTDGSSVPSSYNTGRQRASLDTLAITSDLSSYPLGFDRDSNIPPSPRV